MQSSPIDVDQSNTGVQTDSPSQTVVKAVAEAEGVDEVDLPPLFHAVDPEALDALFHSHADGVLKPRATGSISFTYHGYEVRVTAGGSVQIRERADP